MGMSKQYYVYILTNRSQTLLTNNLQREGGRKPAILRFLGKEIRNA